MWSEVINNLGIIHSHEQPNENLGDREIERWDVKKEIMKSLEENMDECLYNLMSI